MSHEYLTFDGELFPSPLMCAVYYSCSVLLSNSQSGPADADTDAVNATVRRPYEWKYRSVTITVNLKWVKILLESRLAVKKKKPH